MTLLVLKTRFQGNLISRRVSWSFVCRSDMVGSAMYIWYDAFPRQVPLFITSFGIDFKCNALHLKIKYYLSKLSKLIYESWNFLQILKILNFSITTSLLWKTMLTFYPHLHSTHNDYKVFGKYLVQEKLIYSGFMHFFTYFACPR